MLFVIICLCWCKQRWHRAVFVYRTRAEKAREVKPAMTKPQKQPAAATAAATAATAAATAAAESETVDKQTAAAVTPTATATKTTKVKQEQPKKAAKSQSFYILNDQVSE